MFVKEDQAQNKTVKELSHISRFQYVKLLRVKQLKKNYLVHEILNSSTSKYRKDPFLIKKESRDRSSRSLLSSEVTKSKEHSK